MESSESVRGYNSDKKHLNASCKQTPNPGSGILLHSVFPDPTNQRNCFPKASQHKDDSSH